MLILLSTLLLVALMAWLMFQKQANAKKTLEISKLAHRIASEHDIRNDFMYACPKTCVIFDTKSNKQLFVLPNGQWVLEDPFNVSRSYERDTAGLLVISSRFAGTNRYRFKGSWSQLEELHHKFKYFFYVE